MQKNRAIPAKYGALSAQVSCYIGTSIVLYQHKYRAISA